MALVVIEGCSYEEADRLRDEEEIAGRPEARILILPMNDPKIAYMTSLYDPALISGKIRNIRALESGEMYFIPDFPYGQARIAVVPEFSDPWEKLRRKCI